MKCRTITQYTQHLDMNEENYQDRPRARFLIEMIETLQRVLNINETKLQVLEGEDHFDEVEFVGTRNLVKRYRENLDAYKAVLSRLAKR